MTRILVTGGDGFIASHLVRRLVARGETVAITIRPRGLRRLQDVRPAIEVIDGATVKEQAGAIQRFRPVAVFDLAWREVRGPSSSDQVVAALNIEERMEVLNTTALAGAEWWFAFGSQYEYGTSAGSPGARRLDPQTGYGLAKLTVGMAMREIARSHGRAAAWLRLFAAYGPDDDDRRLIPSTIDAMLRGLPVRITAGTQRWDYLYVDDVVAAAVAALDNRLDGAFDLGSGSARAIREIVEQIRLLTGATADILVGALPQRPGDVPVFLADPRALSEASGWRPRSDLDDGLRQTIAWHRARISS